MGGSGTKWYYYQNGKNYGPFSLEELKAKVQARALSGKVHFWREGMVGWEVGETIPDLQSLFAIHPTSPPPPPTVLPQPLKSKTQPRSTVGEELSGLLDLNPKEVQDRTGKMDREALRLARKEAGKAQRKIIRGQVQMDLSRRKWIYLGAAFSLLCIAYLGYTGTMNGVISPSEMAKTIESISIRIISPLPILREIADADYIDMKTAVETNLRSKGIQFAIALAQKDSKGLIFYVATNAPEGMSLSFSLKSHSTQIPTQKPIHIQVPVQVHLGFARTEVLQLSDGQPFPEGDYLVSVVEDDEQSPGVKAALSNVSNGSKKAEFSKKISLK